MAEESTDALGTLSQVEARGILEDLRRGGVPDDHAGILAVGRESWLASVQEDLQFVASGGSKSRLVVAPYGGGKSHFLFLVRDSALVHNFAVSYVELVSREAPLDRFESIFAKIMRQLTAGDGDHGIEHILDNWATAFPYYSAKEIDAALRDASRSLDFRSALRSYLEVATVSAPESVQRRQDIVAWMQGHRLPAALMRDLAIRNPITISNVSEVLSSFLEFLRMAGYSGLVLLLDEAEAITSLSQSRRRDEANQNLRKLLDNTDANRGFYLLFATTPRFIDDPERGARSYPALWDRIRNVLNLQTGVTSKRALIMSLEPLGEHNLAVLAERVVKLHASAWEWAADQVLTGDIIRNYVRHYAERKPDGPVRPFLRALVDLLDVAQESGAGFDPYDAILGLDFGGA